MSGVKDLDKVIGLVKQKTGYPVSVTPSSEIQTHSSMKSATDNIPVHSILVNPKYDQYHICPK